MYTFGFGRYNVVFSSLAAAMLHEFGMSTNPPPPPLKILLLRCGVWMAWHGRLRIRWISRKGLSSKVDAIFQVGIGRSTDPAWSTQVRLDENTLDPGTRLALNTGYGTPRKSRFQNV